MRFLIDECTGVRFANWLAAEGHDVMTVYDHRPGLDDTDVLRLAVAEERVVVTNDKDFGEMIYREGMAHRGVVLLRLDDERAGNAIAVFARVLAALGDDLPDRFVVATERSIRASR